MLYVNVRDSVTLERKQSVTNMIYVQRMTVHSEKACPLHLFFSFLSLGRRISFPPLERVARLVPLVLLVRREGGRVPAVLAHPRHRDVYAGSTLPR